MNWTEKYHRITALVEVADGATSTNDIRKRLAEREWHLCERQNQRDMTDLAEIGILIQFVSGRYRVAKTSTYQPIA